MTTTANTPNSPAEYQLGKFTDAIETIRSHAAAGAKTLGAVGGLAVGAVGVAKFSDVFPVPAGGGLAAVGVVVGVVAMGIAVLWLTIATWRVGDPVFTANDPAKIEDDDARAIAEKIYRDVAGKPSLEDWQQNVDHLEEQARNVPPAERQPLLDQAYAARLEIRATQARVGALVVRERAKNARRLVVLVPTLLLFVAGLSASGLLADKLDAMRTATDTRTATVRACAETAAALTENHVDLAELPDGCARPVLAPATETALANRSEVLGDLTAAYQSCVKANSAEHDKCAWILTLIGDAAG